MTNKEIKIAYREYETIDGLEAEDKALALAAIEAMKSAYAPYSGFNVGAAVMFEDGEIVKGANQENAAYPSGLCAERTVIFYASAAYPGVKFKKLAIAAYTDGDFVEEPVSPCIKTSIIGKSTIAYAIICVFSFEKSVLMPPR